MSGWFYRELILLRSQKSTAITALVTSLFISFTLIIFVTLPQVKAEEKYLFFVLLFAIQALFTRLYMWLLNLRLRDLTPSVLALPQGRLFDALLPPEEAEHRFLELDEAFDRWEAKYGFRNAKILYIWQSVVSICLFWFDRVVVRVLARK